MKRSMCLHIPYLPIERLGLSDRPAGDASPDETPIAVTEERSGTVRVVLCNQTARDGGVRRAMTVAEAVALLPGLNVQTYDAQANRFALKTLAAWAQAFSPIVHIEDSDTLFLDVTGCERLFGGEANLLDRAIEGLTLQGYSSRGAIADTPGAAWAIAHTHENDALVTSVGRDVEDLLRLPVGALRLDGKTVAALAAVGVDTIEALLYLPRACLGVRFGDGLLHRLDQALGRLPEPLAPYHAPPVLRACLRLGAPTDRRDLVHHAASHALAQFCEQLQARMAGVTRLHATFYHVDATPTTLAVDVSQPMRVFKRLNHLLTERMDQTRLPAEVNAVMVWARHTEPLDDLQDELFQTRLFDERDLAELVDRLSMRLGSRAVARVALVDDHQPERTYTYVPCVDTSDGHTSQPAGTSPQRRDSRSQRECLPVTTAPASDARPLRVWSRPVEVRVMSVAPDGPLTTFRFQSEDHAVVTCVGPERVETGWWRGLHVRRDYYRVVDQSGRAFWIFRDACTGRWFVHGVFD